MNHSNCVLFLALILSTFVLPALSPLWAVSSEWDNLTILKPGQLIRVEPNDSISYEGTFQALDDEGITLRQPAGEQTFARKDILRVYFRSKNHRLRNTVIGAGIGAALAALAVKVNNSPWFGNTGMRDIGWVWPVGLGIFGGIGAAIPTGGWHEVYHARRRRGSTTGDARPSAS
jgi:hypothetical protein